MIVLALGSVEIGGLLRQTQTVCDSQINIRSGMDVDNKWSLRG